MHLVEKQRTKYVLGHRRWNLCNSHVQSLTNEPICSRIYVYIRICIYIHMKLSRMYIRNNRRAYICGCLTVSRCVLAFRAMFFRRSGRNPEYGSTGNLRRVTKHEEVVKAKYGKLLTVAVV